MQGSHYGGRDDIGVFNRVDAVLGTSSGDCIWRRSYQSGRQHNTGFVCQVEHMLESNYIHWTQYAGKLRQPNRYYYCCIIGR